MTEKKRRYDLDWLRVIAILAVYLHHIGMPFNGDKFHIMNSESSKVLDNKRIDNFPLSYLGFEFYGYQTLLKSKNLSSFYREMKESISRKKNRIEALKEKNLEDNLPIFKRKIYRLYSFRGIKTRKQIRIILR